MKENLFHIILAKKYPQNRRLLPFHPLPDKERFSLGICCKLVPQPSLLRPEAVVGGSGSMHISRTWLRGNVQVMLF